MPKRFVPRHFFLTRGVGVHKDRLISFEMALRNAGIPQFNLVTVSSILPPHCELVDAEEGLRRLSPGEIVFCVLSRNDTSEPGRAVAASVALARPVDPAHHGYVAEHHDSDLQEEEACAYTERQAVVMLASATGRECDLPVTTEPLSRSEYPPFVKDTMSIAQSAVGAEGLWTTVVSAAVFILPEA